MVQPNLNLNTMCNGMYVCAPYEKKNHCALVSALKIDDVSTADEEYKHSLQV